MANTKSAEKRIRQNETRRRRNRALRSKMRKSVKKLRTAIDTGDQEAASQLLPATLQLIDVTAQKKVIHQNAAARYKSRLTRAVTGVSA